MKKDTLNRFAYIETRLYWGGGLTAGELAQACDLTRQNAQGVIKAYRDKHPGNIAFDTSLKRQVAGEHFEPNYISPSPGPFRNRLVPSAKISATHAATAGNFGAGLPLRRSAIT
jgi:hypothetical protein